MLFSVALHTKLISYGYYSSYIKEDSSCLSILYVISIFYVFLNIVTYLTEQCFYAVMFSAYWLFIKILNKAVELKDYTNICNFPNNLKVKDKLIIGQ